MNSPDASVKRAGRVRDEEKRQAILEAAWDVFMERGVERASIEGIAARARVSKVTVYRDFADKHELFDAVVRRHTDRIRNARLAEVAAGLGSLRERLVAFGRALMHFIMGEEAAQFDAAMSGELRRVPELAALFWAAGPERALSDLAAIIREAEDAGELAVDDAMDAAEDLVGLWSGVAMRRSVFAGTSPDPGARVERGVDRFLKMYGCG